MTAGCFSWQQYRCQDRNRPRKTFGFLIFILTNRLTNNSFGTLFQRANFLNFLFNGIARWWSPVCSLRRHIAHPPPSRTSSKTSPLQQHTVNHVLFSEENLFPEGTTLGKWTEIYLSIPSAGEEIGRVWNVVGLVNQSSNKNNKRFSIDWSKVWNHLCHFQTASRRILKVPDRIPPYVPHSQSSQSSNTSYAFVVALASSGQGGTLGQWQE